MVVAVALLICNYKPERCCVELLLKGKTGLDFNAMSTTINWFIFSLDPSCLNSR